MKKILLLFILGVLSLNITNAQKLLLGLKGGMAFTDTDYNEEALFGLTLENKFNNFLSLGIIGKFGGAEYEDEEMVWNNNQLTEIKELEIQTFIYSAGLFTKLSFIRTDELIISFVPEVSYYWTKARPSIELENSFNGNETEITYKSTHAGDWGIDFHLEAQYFILDRLNITAGIGWNNYNLGSAMNKVNLGTDWSKTLNEKTNFLYVEIGVAFLLFGDDIWF